MSVVASMSFANARAPDRIVAVGRLALRALRHTGQGLPPGLPPIAGLRVEAVGHAERPGWHASTGLYGFVALPPGPCRILVSDPARRFLPAAFEVTVPDRSGVKGSLERGITAPDMTPRPVIRDIALHPAPGYAAMPGVTSVWGVVRLGPGGPAVPLARLDLTTLMDGVLRRLVTWSASDGSYLLPLPGENAAAIGGAPPFAVERALIMHAPRPMLAAALRTDPLGALPAECDAIDPDAPASPFLRRGFGLRAANGGFRPRLGGVDPTMQILGGQQRRWDIELV